MTKAEEYAKESVKKAQLHTGSEFTASRKALEEEIGEMKKMKKFQQYQETQFKSFRESSDLQREQALGQARGCQGKIGEIPTELWKAQESAVFSKFS